MLVEGNNMLDSCMLLLLLMLRVLALMWLLLQFITWGRQLMLLMGL